MVIYYLYFHPTGIEVEFLKKKRKNETICPEDQEIGLELRPLNDQTKKTSKSVPVLGMFLTLNSPTRILKRPKRQIFIVYFEIKLLLLAHFTI